MYTLTLIAVVGEPGSATPHERTVPHSLFFFPPSLLAFYLVAKRQLRSFSRTGTISELRFPEFVREDGTFFEKKSAKKLKKRKEERARQHFKRGTCLMTSNGKAQRRKRRNCPYFRSPARAHPRAPNCSLLNEQLAKRLALKTYVCELASGETPDESKERSRERRRSQRSERRG